MTILTPSQLESARSHYRRLMHNAVTSVRKIVGQTLVQPDPHYEGRYENTLWQFDDFYCSIFHFLSGKTNRLLQERGDTDLIAQLGLTPDTAIVIQYVCDDMLVTPAEGETEPPVLTIVNNLQTGEAVLWRGEWWFVKVAIPDSEGIQHTAFAVK